ncbi:hypothetical protein N7520_000292 [Penicillium odoratum]|uniref:uncharacterized protein n=1 Tax=Penicillium odoratum TaxID=1167516 RepID=UPI002547448D|nr:uncharacterized protein N7520_000292 [Penicillium odoratum]KAJ5777046.1 hypothetical protein N7520_000292 [Penicillium odoratum]
MPYPTVEQGNMNELSDEGQELHSRYINDFQLASTKYLSRPKFSQPDQMPNAVSNLQRMTYPDSFACQIIFPVRAFPVRHASPPPQDSFHSGSAEKMTTSKHQTPTTCSESVITPSHLQAECPQTEEGNTQYMNTFSGVSSEEEALRLFEIIKEKSQGNGENIETLLQEIGISVADYQFVLLVGEMHYHSKRLAQEEIDRRIQQEIHQEEHSTEASPALG